MHFYSLQDSYQGFLSKNKFLDQFFKNLLYINWFVENKKFVFCNELLLITAILNCVVGWDCINCLVESFIGFIFFQTFYKTRSTYINSLNFDWNIFLIIKILGFNTMYNKILITTDGSKSAEKAANHALWIANESDAEILVLNVFELYNPTLVVPFSTIPASNQDMYEPLKKEAENIAEKFIEKLKSSENFNSETDLTMIVRDGKPYQEILKTVDEMGVDLIVMGASGRHGFDRITLGSVTERVVRSAKVPVMVVP